VPTTLGMSTGQMSPEVLVRRFLWASARVAGLASQPWASSSRAIHPACREKLVIAARTADLVQSWRACRPVTLDNCSVVVIKVYRVRLAQSAPPPHIRRLAAVAACSRLVADGEWCRRFDATNSGAEILGGCGDSGLTAEWAVVRLRQVD
jgi:hypothetical protein